MQRICPDKRKKYPPVLYAREDVLLRYIFMQSTLPRSQGDRVGELRLKGARGRERNFGE
jgi:hypothetical protein